MPPQRPEGVADEPTDDPSGRLAEQARRRAAEQALVERLVARNLEGPEFAMFADRFVGRGRRVMHKWTLTKQIFKECRRKGIHLGEPLEWSDEQRCDLVEDTVDDGFTRFCNGALRARKWRPEGGASLGTFYVGNLIYVFGERYREWRDGELARRMEEREAALTLGISGAPSIQRVGAAVIDRMAAMAALHKIAERDPRLACILALHAEGYSFQQIADLLGDGTSARAVEGALYRHHRRLEEGGRP